jgi:hypothetical protein
VLVRTLWSAPSTQCVGHQLGARWPTHCVFMVNKTLYVQRFKNLYQQKSGSDLSDQEALACFEQLVCLVGAVSSHVPISKLIFPTHE